MKAGRHKTEISIEQSSIVSMSAINEPVVTWSTWRTVFVQVDPIKGREAFEVNQRYSEQLYRFEGRFVELEGVDAKMRINFDGTLYNIRSILPDHQNREKIVIEAFAQDVAA